HAGDVSIHSTAVRRLASAALAIPESLVGEASIVRPFRRRFGRNVVRPGNGESFLRTAACSTSRERSGFVRYLHRADVLAHSYGDVLYVSGLHSDLEAGRRRPGPTRRIRIGDFHVENSSVLCGRLVLVSRNPGARHRNHSGGCSIAS